MYLRIEYPESEGCEMRSLGLLCLLFSAALKQFVYREVWPDEKEEQLPPIRYGGDPTEIYLA